MSEYQVTPEEAAEAAKPEAKPEEELIAGKFKSQEDLVNAYKELEGKLGKQPEEEEAKKTELNIEESKEEEEEAKSAVDAAGLDFDALSAEYTINGSLTEESYEKLTKAGIPKQMVDTYIEGVELKANNMRNEVFNAVGGEENYTELITWASTNLKPEEVKAFNKTLESNNMSAITLAVQGINAKYTAAEGSQGQMIKGKAASTVGERFESNQEVATAMQDPRYKTDPAYRQRVYDKLARSNVFV